MNVLSVEKMEWEKPRKMDHPRCAHSCVPVRFRDDVIAGTLVAASEESEGAGQQGYVILGGFSGANVENTVLFVTQGGRRPLFLSLSPFPDFFLIFPRADLSSVVDISDQISGAPPTPSFAHVSLPVVSETTGFTEAILTFGGINLSEDSNNVSLLCFHH